VKDLITPGADFVLANVLQMPLPPKARRRKSDQIDTGRMLREELNGTLPRAYQPPAWLRRARRVVDCRWSLLRRMTAVKNWISLLIESATWLQQIPRYRQTYQRVAARRGKNVARIVVARLFLRSLHKMLRDDLRFNPAPGSRMVRTQEAATATTGC